MSELSKALAAYGSLDPAGWVAVFSRTPWWVGALAVLFGLVLLFWGGGERTFRAVAVPLGAAVGWLLTPWVAIRMGYPHQASTVQATCAIAFSVLGAWAPTAVTFLCVGLPGGFLVGEWVNSKDWLLAFTPAFLLIGMVGALGHRFFSALAASVIGAWFIVIGALSALRASGALNQALVGQPWGILAAASLFAAAGCVYQIKVRPSPQEREERRLEAAQAKRRRQEQVALEERWANYSKNKGA